MHLSVFLNYGFPDFLDLSNEFIEIDSYIVPNSDLCTQNDSYVNCTCILVESDLFEGFNKVGIGNIMEDETLRRILDQQSFNHGDVSLTVYSDRFPECFQLNTPELRGDFADRVAASGHTDFRVEVPQEGRFAGERLVRYVTSGNIVKPSSKIVEILRANL